MTKHVVIAMVVPVVGLVWCETWCVFVGSSTPVRVRRRQGSRHSVLGPNATSKAQMMTVAKMFHQSIQQQVDQKAGSSYTSHNSKSRLYGVMHAEAGIFAQGRVSCCCSKRNRPRSTL